MFRQFGFSRIFMLFTFTQIGCYERPTGSYYGEGGGRDNVTSDLPFSVGYQSICVQGVGGSYSHRYESTYYDVDLDTPNDQDDLVYALIAGTAYVHDQDRTSGFGVHINIDLGDGTYLLLGHLDDVLIEDGEEVAAGQLLGVEGTTGNSTGDHVHLGRHDGAASEDGSWGESIEGLSIYSVDLTDDGTGDYLTSEMTCDLSHGHNYESLLSTVLWHPDGTLVMVPGVSTVYLLSGGLASPFLDEESFWSRGYDFGDLSLISSTELGCYGSGEQIDGTASLSAVYEDGTVWLLLDSVTAGQRARYQVSASGWQAVLKSYGIVASTYDDLQSALELGVDLDDYSLQSDYAVFRDGTLLKESGRSTVYVVAQGVAMPIVDWDTFLLLDYYTRTIIEVDPGVVASVQGRVGDCSADAYCVTSSDAFTCGGPGDQYGSYESTGEREDEMPEDAGGDSDTPVEETTDQSDSHQESGSTGLSLNWQSPGGVNYQRITLSGEYTESGGYSYGWQELSEVTDAASIDYSVVGAHSGDQLRFSVEFEDSSSHQSWSCLAPYPPGTVQGTASASWNGANLEVETADDPSSAGCGLQITIP